MIQRGKHLRFTTETCESFRIVRKRGWQDLECDLAPELRVLRAIHLAHAAGTERGEDLIQAESMAGCESDRRS
jgi:hypothetical protein